MLTLSGPIAAAQAAARDLLTQALAELEPTDGWPAPDRIQFSRDGTGGDLASPYPKMVGLDPALLARQVSPHPFFARCYASGDWIAFDLSELWWQQARAWQPHLSRLPLPPLPPMPRFPARITPEAWRLNGLLGAPSPEVAARLDRGNPAVLLQLVRRRCGQSPEGRRDRTLAGLALMALETREAKKLASALLELSRRYLRAPGEEPLVAKALESGLTVLGISG